MSYKFKLNLLKSIFSAILSAIFAGTYCYLVYNKIIDKYSDVSDEELQDVIKRFQAGEDVL